MKSVVLKASDFEYGEQMDLNISINLLKIKNGGNVSKSKLIAKIIKLGVSVLKDENRELYLTLLKKYDFSQDR